MGSVELREGPDGIMMRVHVLPRGKRNEVVGERNGRLCVRLTAPPVEGAANRALCEFLAELFGVRKSAVSIASGERSREKWVKICGVSRARAEDLWSETGKPVPPGARIGEAGGKDNG